LLQQWLACASSLMMMMFMMRAGHSHAVRMPLVQNHVHHHNDDDDDETHVQSGTYVGRV
jgi:hypothetical protein